MKGLTAAEATARLKVHGYNEMPSAKPKNIGRIALEVIKEPMFLLLISCGALYMMLGDYREGIILLSTIFLIIFITFYQYQKTEKALTALRKLSSPRALVIRDGTEKRIPGREVVPGDVMILNEGDRIAADAKLLETFHLSIDESLLTGESAPVTKGVEEDFSNSKGLVFSGCLVVQGSGYAEALKTGSETQFGIIGASLQSITQDETRLQAEMKVLIRNLFLIGALISVGVVAGFYFSRGNFIQSLLNGLAAAMAILPEEFPVVLTVFLALGAWRLSKKNVLTRKPSAIETLGSATVLCSDKTGTITQNRMEVTAVYCEGEFLSKSSFNDKQRHIVDIITVAFLASHKDSIDPMEKAIAGLYNSLVQEKQRLSRLVRAYPLSNQLLAMTNVLQHNSNNEFLACCKGAPEAVFTLCKMTEDERTKQLSAVHHLAGQSFRVIAVAEASIQNGRLPESQDGFDFRFRGLIAFEDPIRPEAPAAIKECNEAGIKVILITGDFPETAKSIAMQTGMDAAGGILTGDDLKTMNDVELRKRITGINIFARVAPDQKLRIVQALKASNEIVAMTGDGVNDAPALKAADIGISMGNKGTDVAREASSLVLLDDNFASIVAAIRSGRKIFDNLQKAMSYIMAIHIPIIGLALLPAFFPEIPLLLMPLHIVFMELIIDPACSIAFESEDEEKGIMNRPPRNPDHRFFGGRRILLSLMQGTMLLAMVITVYILSIHEGHTDGEVRAIAFSSLIIGNIFLILSSLSRTRSFISVIKERNKSVLIILSLSLLMLMLILSIPALQNIFNFQFPGYRHFVSSVTGAIVLLFVLESIKYLNRRQVTGDKLQNST